MPAESIYFGWPNGWSLISQLSGLPTIILVMLATKINLHDLVKRTETRLFSKVGHDVLTV
jgi:hypothetical protein